MLPCSSATCAEVASEEPPTKRFRHLNKVLERRRKESLKRNSKLPLGKVEVDRYFEPLAEEADPFEYWLSHQESYPLLTSIASSIPEASAPVERVFSNAGESTMGKRNRLS